MEQSQHVNIAARIQQLIVSRHINKQETKMQKAKLKLTNDLYNKYNDESLFVLSPKETQIRKLEQQNKYLERYLNSLLRERKPKRLNRFRIIGKSIIAAYVQKYKENNQVTLFREINMMLSAVRYGLINYQYTQSQI